MGERGIGRDDHAVLVGVRHRDPSEARAGSTDSVTVAPFPGAVSRGVAVQRLTIVRTVDQRPTRFFAVIARTRQK